MNSADKLKRFFQKAELGINSEGDEKIFQDVFNAQQKSIKSKPAQPVHIGRILMKSHLTKIAAAAIVIIACMAGLMMFNKTSNIAFADVQARIKQIRSMIYQATISSRTPNKDRNLPDMEMQGTFLISEEYGTKVTMNIDYFYNEDINSISTDIYFLPKKKLLINLLHNQKFYNQTEISNKSIEEANVNMVNIIGQIDESQITSLGKSTLDGVEVEGFQFNDPNVNIGELNFNNLDLKLWVDVRTKLPVKMEMESLTGTQQVTGTISNFQWNVPVSADDFEPNIPSGYKSYSDMKKEISELQASIPGNNEEITIQSLRFFADVSGRYPTKLDSVTIINEYSKYRRQNNLDENTLQEMSNGKDPIKLLSEMRFFFRHLESDDKFPAYYGDRVTPKDTDHVLMRWKLSDDEYRVIFGNLETDNVTLDNLTRLENNLPEPNAPEDSINSGKISLPEAIERTMLNGLKLFAGLTERYPTEPNSSVIIKEFSDYNKQNIEKSIQFDLQHHEELNSSPYLQLDFFFRNLKSEGRNPIYYGDIVTPKDANEVLLRWKTYGNNYRVIFGNLHTGIVSEEKLASLEENLPKRDIPKSDDTERMRGTSDEIAIEALKLFADVTGHYPLRLNITYLTRAFRENKNNNNTFINVPKEISDTAKEAELFVELTMFFDYLKNQRQNPAYYGDIISTGDANQILMRWKTYDNKYIVVFGDLKIEILSKETLNLLEKTLPK